MQVILNGQVYSLSEQALASCPYFRDLEEKTVDITELAIKQNITSDEFGEFVRLLHDKSYDLTPERLSFYASYFFCEKAARRLLERGDKGDLKWQLDFFKRNPSAQFMIPSIAQAALPQIVSGRIQLSDVPPLVAHALTKPLTGYVQGLVGARFKPPRLYAASERKRLQALTPAARQLRPSRDWSSLSEEEQEKWNRYSCRKIEESVLASVKRLRLFSSEAKEMEKSESAKKRKHKEDS